VAIPPTQVPDGRMGGRKDWSDLPFRPRRERAPVGCDLSTGNDVLHPVHGRFGAMSACNGSGYPGHGFSSHYKPSSMLPPRSSSSRIPWPGHFNSAVNITSHTPWRTRDADLALPLLPDPTDPACFLRRPPATRSISVPAGGLLRSRIRTSHCSRLACVVYRYTGPFGFAGHLTRQSDCRSAPFFFPRTPGRGLIPLSQNHLYEAVCFVPAECPPPLRPRHCISRFRERQYPRPMTMPQEQETSKHMHALVVSRWTYTSPSACSAKKDQRRLISEGSPCAVVPEWSVLARLESWSFVGHPPVEPGQADEVNETRKQKI